MAPQFSQFLGCKISFLSHLPISSSPFSSYIALIKNDDHCHLYFRYKVVYSLYFIQYCRQDIIILFWQMKKVKIKKMKWLAYSHVTLGHTGPKIETHQVCFVQRKSHMCWTMMPLISQVISIVSLKLSVLAPSSLDCFSPLSRPLSCPVSTLETTPQLVSAIPIFQSLKVRLNHFDHAYSLFKNLQRCHIAERWVFQQADHRPLPDGS